MADWGFSKTDELVHSLTRVRTMVTDLTSQLLEIEAEITKMNVSNGNEIEHLRYEISRLKKDNADLKDNIRNCEQTLAEYVNIMDDIADKTKKRPNTIVVD